MATCWTVLTLLSALDREALILLLKAFSQNKRFTKLYVLNTLMHNRWACIFQDKSIPCL